MDIFENTLREQMSDEWKDIRICFWKQSILIYDKEALHKEIWK